MRKIISIFLLAVSSISCEQEPNVLEEQSVCTNELYAPNSEWRVYKIEEFITNDCEPSLPTAEDYDYLYKVYEEEVNADTLYIYSNRYWGNQQHLDNTPIWSGFSDTDLVYNPN
jgi:hypothetical protein